VTASAAARSSGAGTLLASVRRVTRTVRRRADRLGVALLMFVLLLPLLLTMFLGDGR
jgi:hypothetical protein